MSPVYALGGIDRKDLPISVVTQHYVCTVEE